MLFFISVPEEMPPPSLTSLTPTSVLITWSKPAKPNGLIDEYILERRSSETHSNPVVISQVLPSTDMSFVDESVELTPFTTYQYRLMVRNVAGATASQWSTVTTLSASESKREFINIFYNYKIILWKEIIVYDMIK